MNNGGIVGCPHSKIVDRGIVEAGVEIVNLKFIENCRQGRIRADAFLV
jgi:hypothetical protein